MSTTSRHKYVVRSPQRKLTTCATLRWPRTSAVVYYPLATWQQIIFYHLINALIHFHLPNAETVVSHRRAARRKRAVG